MEFADVLEIYEMFLKRIRRFKKAGAFSEEYLEGMRRQNFIWFQDLSLQTSGKEWRELEGIEEVVKDYEFEGELPYRLILYRGVILPIYRDDYGQQDFTVIRNRVISGGSYNSFAVDEFIYEVDKILEEEFLTEE